MSKIVSLSQKLYRRRLFIGLLLGLISIGLTLAILEVAVRLLLPLPYGEVDNTNFYSCHPTLGWTGMPYYHDVIEGPGFQQENRFNSLGMHDTDHSFQKPADTFRILFLGDSFVHAIQVNETATAHQVLEDELNRDHQTEIEASQFEVVSSGVVNWGTNQQLVYYREQGHKFEPDLVLLLFYIGNDFQDNLPGNLMTVDGINCYAPYFAWCEGEFDPVPLTYAPGISDLENNCGSIRQSMINSMGWLYQHSRLYQQIEPLVAINTPRHEFGQPYPSPYSALYLPQDEPIFAPAQQITQATLLQLKQEVEANGHRFAVALISPELIIRLALLSPMEQKIFLEDNPAFAQAQPDRPNRRLTAFLKGENIPFIDLAPPMVEYLAAVGKPLYIVGEGHWTAIGNRAAAEILAQWLTQNQFFQNDENPAP